MFISSTLPSGYPDHVIEAMKAGKFAPLGPEHDKDLDQDHER